MTTPSTTVLSYAFRPFFLLSALAAIVLTGAWVLSLNGLSPWPGGQPGVYWHAHEMINGFVMATVAGFTLSAVATWTGRPAVSGAPLVWLGLAWLAGRVAMSWPGIASPAMVVAADMLFPVMLCILFGREVIGARNRRNYKVVGLVAMLALLNLAYPVFPGESLYLQIHTIVLLVALIGGRIIPNFTANWLRGQGAGSLPANDLGIDRVAFTLTVLVGLAVVFSPPASLSALLAAMAAAAHAIRVAKWHGARTIRNPLLFVLHVAYWWLPVGYALTAASALGIAVPGTAALHALTMGAIGTMIMAMLTRVPLGHTGRALIASRTTVIAYLLLTLAVVGRVAGSLIPEVYMGMLNLAAITWCAAFAIVVWTYWPVLTGPPADD